MPLVLQTSSPTWGELYLWHTEEDASFFKKPLLEVGVGVEHLRKWHPSRQKEWLSGRYLAHRYAKEDIRSLKVNEHGKPTFTASENMISISHTKGIVGLQIHTVGHGLDIQIDTDKVGSVAKKFCSDADRSPFAPFLDQRRAEHYIWGIKEGVYKAYGKKGLSYLDDINITSVVPKGKIFLATIELRRGDLQISYHGKLSRVGPYYICQVIQVEKAMS